MIQIKKVSLGNSTKNFLKKSQFYIMFFKKIEQEEIILNIFSKASVTLIQKHDKHSTKK